MRNFIPGTAASCQLVYGTTPGGISLNRHCYRCPCSSLRKAELLDHVRHAEVLGHHGHTRPGQAGGQQHLGESLYCHLWREELEKQDLAKSQLQKNFIKAPGDLPGRAVASQGVLGICGGCSRSCSGPRGTHWRGAGRPGGANVTGELGRGSHWSIVGPTVPSS